MNNNDRILIISDLHCPYEHPDTFAFLKQIKEQFKPDRIISVGDEVDGHAISFHESNPDLLSPGDELNASITRLKELYELFPEVDLVDSNHGSLVYRKGIFAGLPRHVFKQWREVLEAPPSWRWHDDLTIKMSNGQDLYVCHGKTSRPGALSQTMAMNAVQGHHHEKFQINYWANSRGIYWDMHVGCLIDDKSLAYNYNKTNLKRPIIGVGLIVHGQPFLLPMWRDENNRWQKLVIL